MKKVAVLSMAFGCEGKFPVIYTNVAKETAGWLTEFRITEQFPANRLRLLVTNKGLCYKGILLYYLSCLLEVINTSYRFIAYNDLLCRAALWDPLELQEVEWYVCVFFNRIVFAVTTREMTVGYTGDARDHVCGKRMLAQKSPNFA